MLQRQESGEGGDSKKQSEPDNRGRHPGSLKDTLKISSTAITIESLSSPRAKRAGPKGLRAESARAVTGRRCPHSGRGEDFLMGQPDFFTETAVTPERKVEKSFPRWEINRHAKG